MATSVPSIYEPLDIENYEIRMLTLLPGSPNSIVRCVLKKTNLISPIKYSALSYRWGDPSITTNIIVNDVEYPVTTSLSDALRQLRLLNVPRVWADALCINQNDRQEKSLQVRSMRQVYSRAETTYAWIGKSESDMSATAISFLKHALASEGFAHLAGPENSQAKENYRRQLLDLFCRQYWSRRWIIQELTVSPNIQILCGSEVITLDDLDSALVLCRRLDWWSMEIESAFLNHLELLVTTRRQYKNGDILPLWKLLHSTNRFESTDCRDIIYALIGISSDGQYLVPWPNYREPPEAIIMDFTKALIWKYKYLDLILIDREDKATLPNLPTWSPNWFFDKSLSRKLGMEAQLWKPNVRARDSGGQSIIPNIDIFTSAMSDISLGIGNILCVEGVIVDSINDTTSTLRLGRQYEIGSHHLMERATVIPKRPSPKYYRIPGEFRRALLGSIVHCLCLRLEVSPTPSMNESIPSIYPVEFTCRCLLNYIAKVSTPIFTVSRSREEEGHDPDTSSHEVITQWIQTNSEFPLNGARLKDWFCPRENMFVKYLVRSCTKNYLFLFLALKYRSALFLLALTMSIPLIIFVSTVWWTLFFFLAIVALLQFLIEINLPPNNNQIAIFKEVKHYLANNVKTSFHIPQKLVVSERGILGMACPGAQIGDKICYIAGCTSAAVLRQVGDGRQYQIVGKITVFMNEEDAGLYPGFVKKWTKGTFSIIGFVKSLFEEYEQKAWVEVLKEYKKNGRWQEFHLV